MVKLLFITRTYPPLVGGMERFASDFYRYYQAVGKIDLLANQGGKKALAWFFAKAALALALNSRKYDVIHLYDAVLSPLIPLIRLCSSAKISLTVNGLDIVYGSPAYQRMLRFFLKRADRIIAISQFTLAQCAARGVPPEKLVAVPVGIGQDMLEICSEMRKSEVAAKFRIPSEGKKILLTVGRLVKRKGHSWFIASVLSKLPQNYIYLIAGVGPEEERIMEAVHQSASADRVFLLGYVSEEEKNCLYQISDLFVMPNISVDNDQEGFGIVVLEAGCQGLPVVASNLEGIKDAVIDGSTGRLVDEGDAQGFVDAILDPRLDPSSIRNNVVSRFDWRKIAEEYLREFEELKIQS